MKSMQEETLLQVKQTNGRVSDLERWRLVSEAEAAMLKRGFKFLVIPVFVMMLGAIGVLLIRYILRLPL